MWNKEELPEEWKESIVAPIYKKGDKTDCSNYRSTSLLPTTYKSLSSILLSSLTLYAEEITGNHQWGFRRNSSTTDHVFCIRQKLEKKLDYNTAVHKLFICFKKAYDSVRREVLYNILIEFGIPMQLVRLLKMCLNETYSRVRIDKHLSDIKYHTTNKCTNCMSFILNHFFKTLFTAPTCFDSISLIIIREHRYNS